MLKDKKSITLLVLLLNKKSVASRYSVDHTADPALPESPFACIRPLSILPRTTLKNSLARPEKVCTQWVGLDGIWILSQITQNPLRLARNTHCLANYSKSVVISYSGSKLPWKLLTIVYTGKSLPGNPFVCSCSVPIRVHR